MSLKGVNENARAKKQHKHCRKTQGEANGRRHIFSAERKGEPHMNAALDSATSETVSGGHVLDSTALLAVSRPVVRWHGGKWILGPWIASHFPKHRVYVEAFGGGGSVLMRKDRSYAEVYNDLDGEIVNLFRVLRDRGQELRRQLELTPFSRVDFRESYAQTDEPVEQARRTVVRSFMGFGSNAHNKNTGFRSNSNCSGTTPAHDWRNYPTAIPAMIERLRGVVIENRDACEVMTTHDGPQTLHYVDPPYVPETRDKGSDYRHEMTEDDHRKMAAVLESLTGAVVLSGYGCKLYEELFAGWTRVERRALADGARARTEVLWLRNVEMTPDLFSANVRDHRHRTAGATSAGSGATEHSACQRVGVRWIALFGLYNSFTRSFASTKKTLIPIFFKRGKIGSTSLR